MDKAANEGGIAGETHQPAAFCAGGEHFLIRAIYKTAKSLAYIFLVDLFGNGVLDSAKPIKPLIFLFLRGVVFHFFGGSAFSGGENKGKQGIVTDFFDKGDGLFKFLGSFAGETNDHIRSEHQIGHYRFGIPHQLQVLFPVIVPVHSLQHPAGTGLEGQVQLLGDFSIPRHSVKLILKSDGASLYSTTDLATLVMRMEDYNPESIIYITDKRQELHFKQVFRCAKKTGIVKPETELTHIGFGTMNGKDGKPFKTRDGGVMRLEYLLEEIYEEMLKKILENQKTKENLDISMEEAQDTARKIALAAIKYGDLSNQASKDYIFDIERFTSFEGNTGPYILYTIVRIKSILGKYEATGKSVADCFGVMEAAHNEHEKALMLSLSRFNAVVENAYEESAPHKLCAYIYELANAFNGFYHGTKILSEENEAAQKAYIGLLCLTKSVLETCIDMLGFEAPERM